MITREQRALDWIGSNCVADPSSSVRLSDAYASFQGAEVVAGFRRWPEGYSVSPKLFALMLRRAFPAAIYRRSNGSLLDGVRYNY